MPVMMFLFRITVKAWINDFVTFTAEFIIYFTIITLRYNVYINF